MVRSDQSRPAGQPRRTRPLMRKYEVSFLAPNGDVENVARLAPATALFESAFMAFARGTLIATPEGALAVEDLVPGMTVLTVDGGPETVVWTGTTTVVPGAAGQSEDAGRLTRIPADTMGFQRPSHDLLLGLGARIFRVHRGLLVPATDLIDGEAAFSVTPPSPVRVYHLALRHHACIRASGVEMETFHPGDTLRRLARPEIKSLYMSLFPHARSAEDFGPLRIARETENPDLGGLS
ncbi:MAG: Hint domain-containing protein [Pseudomonadota bacterium]